MRKRFTYLLLLALLVAYTCGCSAKENEDTNTVAENVKQEENTETQNSEKKDVVDITTEDENEGDTVELEDKRDTSLNGRGNADVGRSEPEYVGLIGYIAVQNGDTNYDKIDEVVWNVPTYVKDKQFWVEDGKIEHKTEVLVKEQFLEHEGYGRYSGYLCVEKTDTKEQVYIDVKEFVTNPYWLAADAREAVRFGDFIAKFKQVSDYYPVNKSGEKVELADGTMVLAVGTTGTYGKGGPDKDTNEIEAVVISNSDNSSRIFINKNDLTIVY